MTIDHSRVMSAALRSRIMSADEAAALVPHGANVGMSGFTGSGYPKAVPLALARRIEAAQARGEPFRIGVWTGASTAPELDGALAKVNGIELRLPYQSDPITRERINAGAMEYIDIHLSHVAQFVWFGFLGHLDIALVEVTAILPDGSLVPSTSIGNNKTWLDQADKIILEVNSGMNPALQGMHDIYYGTRLPPHRKPIPILAARRPDRRDQFSLRPGQGDRGGRDQCAGPQHHLRRARPDIEGDRRPHSRISRPRGSPRQAAARNCCRSSPGSATSPMR